VWGDGLVRCTWKVPPLKIQEGKGQVIVMIRASIQVSSVCMAETDISLVAPPVAMEQ
jgi:hypothetical protein